MLGLFGGAVIKATHSRSACSKSISSALSETWFYLFILASSRTGGRQNNDLGPQPCDRQWRRKSLYAEFATGPRQRHAGATQPNLRADSRLELAYLRRMQPVSMLRLV